MNFLRRLAFQGGKNLMTAHVSMLLKSSASLTCFRACFLPGRAKDLSAPRNIHLLYIDIWQYLAEFQTAVAKKGKNITFYVLRSFSDNLSVCEIRWKSMIQPDGSHILHRKDSVCMLDKCSKNTYIRTYIHTKYLILFSFPRR